MPPGSPALQSSVARCAPNDRKDPLLLIVNLEQLLQLTRALQPLTAKPVHKANAPGA